MFFGTYNHTIDAKGRTSLPAKFRDVLAGEGEPRLFVMRNPHSRALLGLPPAMWSKLVEKVGAASPFDASMQRNVLKFVSSAQELAPDVHGRVLVPPALREWAGLQKELVWVGMGPFCLLYDQATYEAEMASELAASERIDFWKHGA